MSNEPVESFVLDEGIDPFGIHTQVSFEGDRVIKKQTYDVEPLLEACKEERNATSGERWGEMRKVGSIPMAVYTRYLSIQGTKERQKFLRKWLKENPAFITFDRYMK